MLCVFRQVPGCSRQVCWCDDAFAYSEVFQQSITVVDLPSAGARERGGSWRTKFSVTFWVALSNLGP